MLSLKETPNGVAFAIQVVPRSRKCEIVGILNGALKVRLTAPPVDGKANEECLRLFSDLFGISRNRISITSGQTSRKKNLLVSGMGEKELAAILSVAIPPNYSPELFDLVNQEDYRP